MRGIQGTSISNIVSGRGASVSARGILLGHDGGTLSTGCTVQDLEDDGSDDPIRIVNFQDSTFRRLRSSNCRGGANPDGGITIDSAVTNSTFEDLTVVESARLGHPIADEHFDVPGALSAGRHLPGVDLSLLATDTVARNMATVPSGNDVVVFQDELPGSTPLTGQADCNTYAPPGSTFVAGTPNTCQSRGLRDAVELMFDDVGDDDNLCESNERCLFSPNAGAYQGHGALVSAGTFVDDEITGVTLLRYETNGR